jgi:hypothetical protein
MIELSIIHISYIHIYICTLKDILTECQRLESPELFHLQTPGRGPGPGHV